MSRLRPVHVALGSALLALAVLPGLLAPAASAPLPPRDFDQAAAGTTQPMWQTNGTVEALTVSKGVVYAGGRFTRVRPPGAAPGTNQTARTYLAAFNASTGALVPGFNVRIDGNVADLAVSADGSRLFLVGAFSRVNGTARRGVAAVNLPSGTLVTGWQANLNANGTAVDATPDAVYVSGDFTTVRGVAKERLARLSPATGVVDAAFTASLDRRANAVEAVPEHERVLVGGNFVTVNGQDTGGMAAVHPATGAVQPWQANTVQPINKLCAGRVTDIVAAGEMAYVTGEGDPPGCYEGTYQARISDGQLMWNSECLGATQGITVMDGVLYKASHQHDCAFTEGDARGGYVGGTKRETFVRWHLLAQDVDTGAFLHWSPDTNGSGPQPIGPHVIRNDGTQLFVGGDFTRVEGRTQQGLARFGRGDTAVPKLPAAPIVRSIGAGRVRVTWPATYDPDSGTLTYTLARGGSTTPIHTVTAESWPWTRPVMRFDETRPAGTTASYRLRVSDGTRISGWSRVGSAVVASAAPPPYADLVAEYGADLHWDFDDATTTVADRSGHGAGGQLVGGTTAGQPGAFTGGSSVLLDGSSGYVTSDASRSLSPSFSQSVWFRTTSIEGGSILGVTDVRTGDGTYSDRAVTMDNNGNVVFSVHRPPADGSPDPLGPRLNNVRLEGPVYNDGRWHHLVATWDEASGTATLYLDGSYVFQFVGDAGGLTDGFQRVGYTDLAKEQAVFGRNFYNLTWPGREHFTGWLDEVSTFPRALTAAEVARLYEAGAAQGG